MDASSCVADIAWRPAEVAGTEIGGEAPSFRERAFEVVRLKGVDIEVRDAGQAVKEMQRGPERSLRGTSVSGISPRSHHFRPGRRYRAAGPLRRVQRWRTASPTGPGPRGRGAAVVRLVTHSPQPSAALLASVDAFVVTILTARRHRRTS